MKGGSGAGIDWVTGRSCSSAISAGRHAFLPSTGFLLNAICSDIHSQGCCGKHSSRKCFWSLDWKKCRIGNVFLFIKKQRLLLSVHVDDIRMTGRKKNMTPMWKKLMKNIDPDETDSFLDHVYFFCLEQLNNYLGGKTSR